MGILPSETPSERSRQPPDAADANPEVHSVRHEGMVFRRYAILQAEIEFAPFLAGTAHPVAKIVVHAAIHPVPIPP